MGQIGPQEIGANLAFGVNLALFILQCNFKCTVRFICLKHMFIIRMIYLNSSKCSHLIWQNCYYQVLHSWIDLFWKLAWKIESQNYPIQQILFESLNSHEFPDLTFIYIYEVNVPKFQTTSSWTWISKSKSGHRGSSIFFPFQRILIRSW